MWISSDHVFYESDGTRTASETWTGLILALNLANWRECPTFRSRASPVVKTDKLVTGASRAGSIRLVTYTSSERT
jgi:hypothetical protein